VYAKPMSLPYQHLGVVSTPYFGGICTTVEYSIPESLNRVSLFL
jgi:hypothetical protein